MRKMLISFVCIAALLATSDASAHTKRYERTSTAQGGTKAIRGSLQSSQEACIHGQQISLFQGGSGGVVVLAGTTYTDDAGNFTFEPGYEGTFTAFAPKSVVQKGNGHKHVCKSVESEPVEVQS